MTVCSTLLARHKVLWLWSVGQWSGRAAQGRCHWLPGARQVAVGIQCTITLHSSILLIYKVLWKYTLHKVLWNAIIRYKVLCNGVCSVRQCRTRAVHAGYRVCRRCGSGLLATVCAGDVVWVELATVCAGDVVRGCRLPCQPVTLWLRLCVPVRARQGLLGCHCCRCSPRPWLQNAVEYR